MKRGLAGGALTAFLCAAAPAAAQGNSTASDDNIVGRWMAVIVIGDSPQPIFFDIRSQKLSSTQTDALKIKFGSPRDVACVSEYSGYLNGWHNYTTHTSEYCNWKEVKGHDAITFRFQLLPGGNLRYELRSDGKTMETAVAEPDREK